MLKQQPQQRVFAVNIPDSHLTDALTNAETGCVTPSGKKKKKMEPGFTPRPGPKACGPNNDAAS